MHVLITGVGGFIGFHSAAELLRRGHKVSGIDNLNDYYDPVHKERRLKVLRAAKDFAFFKGDICDQKAFADFYGDTRPTHVLHLAAQAGVRYSLENPLAYIQANGIGFQNMIELVRHSKPDNFVYASSSSVYGGNKQLPFSESQNVNNPISLYAATKIGNELVANAYGHLFGIPSTGLRFFTVYGPYSRPDMAMFKFGMRMLKGEPLPVYNGGNMTRDFTFVSDIVDGILRALDKPEKAQIYNLGRGAGMNLNYMIDLLEKGLAVKAQREQLPMQAGDVQSTLADISKAGENLGFKPQVSLEEGVRKFCEWFTKEFK